ncbi:hypothetical protein EJ08DRAFT_647080 [Tothia fuscella]|uniref:N-acetyltransferase domain-containing protein n=1 Tax=Tothia fuscella TaxID=1048955 RepID=A0A9P4NY33_9PEZI|nr:hypothetical protein EJ08DRAFT_647080 [Tothia fuscella]
MPAMLDDPTAAPLFRSSGEPPYHGPLSSLPESVVPRQVTLRDRVTKATLIPFSSPDQVPMSLISYLCDQLNKEIEKGDTYPMIDPMPLEKFGPYWFANFGAVMLLGDVQDAYELHQLDLGDTRVDAMAAAEEGRNTPANSPPPTVARRTNDWEKECLGSFYIKPNYPGRSSHVCNGGFLVTDGARNRGVGRLMGEGYLEWAPKLGYTYSIFNLVYETNVASCRIWDALGFKRVGRVKGCGNLKSYPNQLIDAIIYGRDLGPEGEDYVSEERFEKIKFYLKFGKYPQGADRAEKSRLRSAATHYKLIPGDPETLMLKGKEVISDPQAQYDVARRLHIEHHGGINKTTASIADKYHWVRIKETVSQVIKNCPVCKEVAKGTPKIRYASSAQTSIVPYLREYSVPPGENWLRLYGAATTPGMPFDEEPVPLPPLSEQGEEDAQAGEEVDGQNGQQDNDDEQLLREAVGETHMESIEYSTGNGVPVDPLLMDGIEHSNTSDLLDAQQIQDFLDAEEGSTTPGAEIVVDTISVSVNQNGTPRGRGRPSRGKRPRAPGH